MRSLFRNSPRCTPCTNGPQVSSGRCAACYRKQRDIVAVRDLSFPCRTRRDVAFLGPNDTGKTTTLTMLSGLLHPTAGDVQVLQCIPWKRQAEFLKRFPFIMGQRRQLGWELPPSTPVA